MMLGNLLLSADGASGALALAVIAVAVLIAAVTLLSAIVGLVLAVSYVKYNRRPNSAGITGAEAARQVLDANGLADIKVKTVGSVLFGNSYSHIFKTVRLRRLTRNKRSLSALAMGVQKSCLAILDKEGDPAMRRRVRLVPLMTVGPLAFLPLVLAGALFDFLLLKTGGVVFCVVTALAFVFYLLAVVASVLTLRTEKRAQERAYAVCRESGLATEEELAAMRRLFRLYNIQYVNDIVLSALELLYRVLSFFLRILAREDRR